MNENSKEMGEEAQKHSWLEKAKDQVKAEQTVHWRKDRDLGQRGTYMEITVPGRTAAKNRQYKEEK